MLLWIARAHYLRSKETRDHLSVDVALRWTEKAHHLQPTNVLIIYNMAMLAQVYCATITERNVTERSLKQLNKAVGRANWAKTYVLSKMVKYYSKCQVFLLTIAFFTGE